MHTTTLTAIILGLLATMATAAPSANPDPIPEAEPEAIVDLDARGHIRWKARNALCSVSWAGRCYSTCVSEGRSRGCKAGSVGSSIDGGQCPGWIKSHCKCDCDV